MSELEDYIEQGLGAGCPPEQIGNFVRAGVVLQPRQLAASAAARFCDRAGGPTAIGYGGARGGGKSHWLLAQMGADDCQRAPGLKCLLLRKVGKANTEHFEELQRRLFAGLRHEFSAYKSLLRFGNGSQIQAGHYQAEKDRDSGDSGFRVSVIVERYSRRGGWSAAAVAGLPCGCWTAE